MHFKAIIEVPLIVSTMVIDTDTIKSTYNSDQIGKLVQELTYRNEIYFFLLMDKRKLEYSQITSVT